MHCKRREQLPLNGVSYRSSRNLHSRQPERKTARCIRATSDIVVVGAGVIGLCCAKALLENSTASVLVLESGQLCSGATGAGQGYIWLAHRRPASAAWSLAARSKAMWSHWQGTDSGFRSTVSWQDTGSILLGYSAAEQQELEVRHALLRDFGIQAQMLDSRELKAAEPALACTASSVGLLVPDDAQLDGRHAAAELLRQCNQHSSRFQACMGQTVQAILTDEDTNQVLGVICNGQRVLARHVVLAAGAWTGALLAKQTQSRCVDWIQRLVPRRGHLIELQLPTAMPHVSHGLMESEYTQHYAAAPVAVPADDAGAAITFTATTSAAGTLLLGSSREFSGWDMQPTPAVVTAILDRAARFLPDLQELPSSSILDVRVGLRPFCADLNPLIGPVPGIPGLYIAAGHEGSGLTLGPATGQLLAQHVLDSSAIAEADRTFLP